MGLCLRVSIWSGALVLGGSRLFWGLALVLEVRALVLGGRASFGCSLIGCSLILWRRRGSGTARFVRGGGGGARCSVGGGGWGVGCFALDVGDGYYIRTGAGRAVRVIWFWGLFGGGV